jgi:hypothetical protein
MINATRQCPHCQQILPADSTAAIQCSNCGRAIQPTAADAVAGATGKSQKGWIVFVLVLLLPALLTLLTAKSDNLWPVATFLVGAGAALYCGFWMAWRLCRTTVGKVAAGLALSAGFYVVSFILCCAGCALGGANVNFH